MNAAEFLSVMIDDAVVAFSRADAVDRPLIAETIALLRHQRRRALAATLRRRELQLVDTLRADVADGQPPRYDDVVELAEVLGDQAALVGDIAVAAARRALEADVVDYLERYAVGA